jgi:8-oxo-dGTP pyrophosphatase MutT (NUDIX family)
MPADPIPASTVILVKETSNGLQTYLLEKSKNLEFAGGAYVFPGGTIQKQDRNPEWFSHISGVPFPDWQKNFVDCSEIDLLGFYISALRELFEEAGILLCQSPPPESLKKLRKSLLKGKPFLALIKEHHLKLSSERLIYLSHWITPEVFKTRFSARFFITEISPEQTPSPDRGELLTGIWISPQKALEQYKKNQISLMFPTMTTLQELSHFKTVKEILGWGRKFPKTPRQPWVDEKGEIHLE